MRKLGMLGITLFGLWLVASSVDGIFSGINYVITMSKEIGRLPASLAIAPGIILLVAGVLLVAFRQKIARSLFEDEPVDVAVSGVSALRVGLVLLGVWLLITAASQLTYTITNTLIMSISDQMLFGAPSGSQPMSATVARAVPHVLEIVVGVLLIVFSAALSGRIWNGQQFSPNHSAATTLEAELAHCEACGEPYEPADYEPGSNARCVRCGTPLQLGS